MDKYFIRYVAPWSMAYKKYQVAKKDKGYVIEIKPSWKRKYIFDSSTLGKYHDTEQEALDVLNVLYSRYKRNSIIEWEHEAKREYSKFDAICYKKWTRKKAHQLGVNKVLVEGRYIEEYRKSRGFGEENK